MRKTLLSVVATLLVCLFFLTACQRHTGFRRLLSEADSLMRVDPDSAFRLLCRLDSAAESLPQSLRMQTLLLRCNAQNKADSLFENDSLGLLLTDYFDRKGTPNQRMLAHYILGCAYRDLDDRPAAIRCFNDAVAAADTAANDCDIRQLSIIYGQIGGIYNKLCLVDEALQAYHSAELLVDRLGDSLHLFNIWANKAESYLNRGDFKTALELKEKAADGYEAHGYPAYAALTRGGCIKGLVFHKQFEKAKAYLDEYKTNSGLFASNGDALPGNEMAYEFIGHYYAEIGRQDSAAYYFYKLQKNAKSLDDLYTAAWCLSRLYKRSHQSDSVAKYAYWGDLLGDTLYSDRQTKQFQQNQAFYNNSRHKQEALRYKVENLQTQRQLFLSIFLVAILLALVIGTSIWYRRRMKRQRRQENLWKLQAINSIQEQKEQLKNSQNEKEHLNQELKEKKETIDKLLIKIQKQNQKLKYYHNMLDQDKLNGELICQQAQAIKGMSEHLAEYKQHQNKIACIKNYELLLLTPIVRRFMELSKKQKEYPTKEEWAELATEVNKLFPSFIKFNDNASFSLVEQQICLLVKIGLDLPSIIFLMNSNNKNITAKRSRMYKKLTGENGGAKDFDEYIRNLL